MIELERKVLAIERPHPNLFTYYTLSSFLLGPFFFLYLIPRYFRYRTLHYGFDREGIQMKWGILFRREISLTYARIQDIHLASNFVERWLGLARVEVQTASGSAKAELTIEGVQEFEIVRDFLYLKMRGARGVKQAGEEKVSPESTSQPPKDTLAGTLAEIAREIRSIREALERQSSSNDHRGPQ